MTDDEIKRLICDLFLDGDVDFPLTPDMQLLEEGICDSLGLLRLGLEVEKRNPGLKVRDQDVTRDNFGSITAIRSFLVRNGR
jgi:acyl carrier protein